MAKKQDEDTGAEAAAQLEKPKGKLKLILLLGGVVLLVATLTGVGVWFFMSKSSGAKSEESKPAAEAAANVKPAAVYQSMEPPFVLNFQQAGRPRYMQISAVLMGRDQKSMEALNVHAPLLRNELVMLFSAQNFDDLKTPQGVESLKEQATKKMQDIANREIGAPVVESVLFTNFVLQ